VLFIGCFLDSPSLCSVTVLPYDTCVLCVVAEGDSGYWKRVEVLLPLADDLVKT